MFSFLRTGYGWLRRRSNSVLLVQSGLRYCSEAQIFCNVAVKHPNRLVYLFEGTLLEESLRTCLVGFRLQLDITVGRLCW